MNLVWIQLIEVLALFGFCNFGNAGLDVENMELVFQMDKASIIGDAIDYVRELQKELEEIESEIDDLEQKCSGSVGDEAGSVEAATGENFSEPSSSNPGSGAELVQGGEAGVDTTVTVESSVDKASADSTHVQMPAQLVQKILEVSCYTTF